MKEFKILDHCIACVTCSKAAPHVFGLNESCTTAVVIQQPKCDESMKKSFQALKSCPVSAIGIRR